MLLCGLALIFENAHFTGMNVSAVRAGLMGIQNYCLSAKLTQEGYEPVYCCDCNQHLEVDGASVADPIFGNGSPVLGIGSILFRCNGMTYVRFYGIPDAARIYTWESRHLKRRAALSNNQIKQQTKKSIRKSFAFNLCYVMRVLRSSGISIQACRSTFFPQTLRLDEDAMELNLCFVPKEKRALLWYRYHLSLRRSQVLSFCPFRKY